MTMNRHALFAHVHGLVCVAGLTLAASSAYAHGPRFEPAPCPVEVSASIDPEVLGDVDCGFVEVPESYEPSRHAKSARLRLFIVRAKTSARRPGTPVFLVTGGPGQSLSAIAGQVFTTGVMGRVRTRRDVVLIDPRGSGFSQPRLACLPPPLPGAAVGDADLTPVQLEAVRCADALIAQNVDLAAYNTPNLVRDLERVRRALRLSKVSLYAVSYGAYVGLQALRGGSDWIESAVLVSIPRPNGGTVVRSGQSAQSALDTFAETCAAQPVCRAYGDFLANLDALLALVTAQPLEIALPPPAASPFPLDPQLLGTFLQLAFSDPALGSTFPKAVSEALRGDTSLWVPYAQELLKQTAVDPALLVSLPLHHSIWCSEELTIGSPEEMERRAAGAATIVQRNFVTGLQTEYEICEVWPVPAAGPELYEPVQSDIPVYLISGALDPITPPSFSRSALRYLANGQLTVVASAGHLAAEHNACTPELVQRFLDAPYARIDGSCAEAPLSFVP